MGRAHLGRRGDHHPGQVQFLQQRLRSGDLVGLVIDLRLGQHDPVVMGDCGDQVWGAAVGVGVVAGTASR